MIGTRLASEKQLFEAQMMVINPDKVSFTRFTVTKEEPQQEGTVPMEVEDGCSWDDQFILDEYMD